MGKLLVTRETKLPIIGMSHETSPTFWVYRFQDNLSDWPGFISSDERGNIGLRLMWEMFS
jgi:hypothetical protein